MNKANPETDTYCEAETVERREALLKRMLTTPPKPLKDRERKRD